MAELIIIRGLPGSGKSFMAKNQFPGHLHYEPDHLFCDSHGRYRYEHQLWEDACLWVQNMTDSALSRGEDVVVSDVFPKFTDLDPYHKIANAHGAQVKIITVNDNYKNTHDIPLFVLKRMKDSFEN